MMALLLPLGLLALGGLAIPLAIHWLRKSEERVVAFAAWRYLIESRLPREQLRLRQLGLLALRLLLMALVALLIAMPVWRGAQESPQAWVVVSPDVPEAQARAAVAATDAQWHWLQADYPVIGTPPASTADLGLLRQLDAELPLQTALTVIVPETLKGLDGERLQLRREVNWVPVAGAPAIPDVDQRVRVVVRHDADAVAEVATLRALFAAWATAGREVDVDIGDQALALPPDFDLLIWLGGTPSTPAMDWVARGGSLLRTRDAQGGWPLQAEDVGRGRIWRLDSPFSPDRTPALADPSQVTALRTLLLTPAVAPDRAYAESMKPRSGAADSIENGKPLDTPLLVLVAMLATLERVLASWIMRRRNG
jgi:hypothetical protein